jgi:hypothetical protein
MIDSLFHPFYLVVKWVCRLFPVNERQAPKRQLIFKFFGIGSIVRIAHVIDNSKGEQNNIELVTFHKNKDLCELLGIEARYIRTNPLFLLLNCGALVLLCWRSKNMKVIDMERASNLVGIFRELCAIGKPQVTFELEPSISSNGRIALTVNNETSTRLIANALTLHYLPKAEGNHRSKSSKTILVNINAGEYIPERKLPLDIYAKILTEIYIANPQVEFELTGSAKERPLVQKFISEFKLSAIPIINKAGDYSLKEFVENIKTAQMVLTNDSSPLHLANYFNTPCVTFWGPTSSKLVGYPDADKMLNIFQETPCSPCFLHPKSKVAQHCSGKLDCFKALEIKSTVKKIVKFMNMQPSLV